MLRKLLLPTIVIVLAASVWYACGLWCEGAFLWHPPYALPQEATSEPVPGTAVDIAAGQAAFTTTLLNDGRVLLAGARALDVGSDQTDSGVALFDPASGNFGALDKLDPPIPGRGATVTALADGRMLFAGGSKNALYAPDAGTVTVTGSLAASRQGHSATLLRDGRVLVVGGESLGDDGRPVVMRAGAEVYDPKTGRFSPAGELAVARTSHCATLMRDGRVLVTGGLDADKRPLDSVELWDPATGRFSPATPMQARRAGQTATLLASGKVLLVGGHIAQADEVPQPDSQEAPVTFTRAELYDPAGESLALPQTRFENGQSATRLPDGRVVLIGQIGEGPASVELFNPANNGFVPMPDLPKSLVAHAATLLSDGVVLISGGMRPLSTGVPYDDECLLWHADSGSVTPAPALKRGHAGHIAVHLPNDNVLIFDTGYGRTTEMWAQNGGGYLVGAAVIVQLAGHSATLLRDGKVLLAGGRDDDFQQRQGGGYETGRRAHAEAMLFDPVTRALRDTGRLGTARDNASATLLADGRVLIAGGHGGGISSADMLLASAEVFDPKTGSFSPAGHLNHAREGHKGFLLANGKVLIVGGWGTASGREGVANTLRPACPGAELWDPATGSFSDTSSPAGTNCTASATQLKNGQVLVTGGGASTVEAEVYDMKRGRFAATGSAKLPGDFFQDVTLQDGRVLVAGGKLAAVRADMGGPGYAWNEARAALYDPERGGFITNFTFAGVGVIHQVLELQGARLLVIGESGSGIFDEARLPRMAKAAPVPVAYKPSGAFLPTGDLLQERYAHSATLLADGSILIAGGRTAGNPEPPEGWMPVLPDGSPAPRPEGEYAPGETALAGAEVYDPGNGSFHSTGALLHARYGHTATLLKDGRVLVAGGHDAQDAPLASAELYDPKTGRFSAAADLPYPLIEHSATVLADGHVLIVGGIAYDSHGLHSSSIKALLFDPATGHFAPTGAMILPRHSHKAMLLPDGRVLIAGGSNLEHIIDTGEIYDPTTGKFTQAGADDPRHAMDGADLLPNGLVLLKAEPKIMNLPVLFDPLKHKYDTMLDSQLCPHGATALLQDKSVLLLPECGHEAEPWWRTASRYREGVPVVDALHDLRTAIHHDAMPLHTRRQARATVLNDGRVLITGGYEGEAVTGSPDRLDLLKAAELYDPRGGAVLVERSED